MPQEVERRDLFDLTKRPLHQAIKKPEPFQAGLRFKMMRSFDYARTAPEAQEGFPVFVVCFAHLIMAEDHMGGADRRQRPLRGIIGFNEVEFDVRITP